MILSIAQTPDGFLWLGTTHGLARFDGVRFENFLSTRAPQRFGTRIEDLDVDANGRLWIVAEQRGLLTVQQGQWAEFHTNHPALKNPPVSVVVDAAGWVWVADVQGNMARWAAHSPTRLEPVGFKLAPGARLLNDGQGNLWAWSARSISAMVGGSWTNLLKTRADLGAVGACRTGGLWLALTGWLHRLEPTGELRPVVEFPWELGTTAATCLLEDPEGEVWIGTSNQGLLRWAQGKFHSVLTSPRTIRCLARDRDGHLWVGTRGGGVLRVSRRVFHVLDARTGLRNEYINSLAEDGEGRIWVSTEERGLGWWANGRWQPVGREQGWPGLEVVCLAADREGRIWLASVAQGLWQWQNNQFQRLALNAALPAGVPRCLHVARDGTLWLALDNVALFSIRGGMVRRHGFPNGLHTRRVRAISEDVDGGVWAGDWLGGVWRFDGNRWQEIRAPSSTAEAARALAQDARGVIWLATAGAGLLRLAGDREHRIGRAHGLPDEDIEQMIVDGDTLWFGTSRGLFHVSLQQLEGVVAGQRARIEAVHHGPSEGLPELHFTGRYQPRNVRAQSGELWFATASGAIHFQPAQLQANGPLPRPLVEAILVNGRPHPPTDRLMLRSDARRVEFRFTAPYFTTPERLRFRYQLLGVDEDWVECGTNRVAVYPSLPFGVHSFRVVAGDAAGLWGQASSPITVVMQPYFWHTRWFVGTVFTMLTAGLAWGVHRLTLRSVARRIERLRQAHALERERARISRDIHDELGANLTAIGLLADMAHRHRNHPETLARDLAQISEMARRTAAAMDAIVWAINPHNDSLDHFANYIGQYTREFFRPTTVRTRLDFPPTLPPHPMPAPMRHSLFLMVKEALNNVARHAQATEVRVSLEAGDNALRLTVEDNGRGLPPEPLLREGHNGLRSMRARAVNLGGTMDIHSGIGRGTRLVFTVPLPPSKTD